MPFKCQWIRVHFDTVLNKFETEFLKILKCDFMRVLRCSMNGCMCHQWSFSTLRDIWGWSVKRFALDDRCQPLVFLCVIDLWKKKLVRSIWSHLWSQDADFQRESVSPSGISHTFTHTSEFHGIIYLSHTCTHWTSLDCNLFHFVVMNFRVRNLMYFFLAISKFGNVLEKIENSSICWIKDNLLEFTEVYEQV